MAWIVSPDLDEQITVIREAYERENGRSISKKDMIKKLIFENPIARSIIENNGIKIDKEIKKLPSL